jgi:hypothetical protein
MTDVEEESVVTTLVDVIREAKRSVAEWPEWMREAAKEVVEHFERRSSTGNNGEG